MEEKLCATTLITQKVFLPYCHVASPPAPTALIKGVMMIVEFIREEQRKYNASFKKLANDPKTRPDAVKVAQNRLRSAGILDKDGKLANPYR